MNSEDGTIIYAFATNPGMSGSGIYYVDKDENEKETLKLCAVHSARAKVAYSVPAGFAAGYLVTKC